MIEYINKNYQINTRMGKYVVQYVFKNVEIAADNGYTNFVCSVSVGLTNEVGVYEKKIDNTMSLYAVVDILSAYKKHKVAPIHWCMVPSELDEFRAVSNYAFVTFEQLADKYRSSDVKCCFKAWVEERYGGFAISNIFKEMFKLGKYRIEYNGERYVKGSRLRIIGANTKQLEVEFLNTSYGNAKVKIPIAYFALVPVNIEVRLFYPENCALGL